MSTFTPAIRTDALTDLVEGLENLRGYGWTQGSYSNDEGAYCSLGALQSDGAPGTYFLAQAIRESGWTPIASSHDHPFSEWGAAGVLIAWNDVEGRTWEQVEAMWIAAIKLAQAAQ